MNRPIQTAPVDELEFDDVLQFCESRVEENIRLEYKQEFSSKDRGKQVAKEVCAFANTEGGLIVYGVAEEDRKPAPNQAGKDLGADPKDAVQSACFNKIWPPVTIEVSGPLKKPGDPTNAFLVIRVHPTDDVHGIGRKVYIRTNDHSNPIEPSVDEWEYLLKRRRLGRAVQSDRRSKALERLSLTIGKTPTSQGQIWIVVGPRNVTRDLFSVRELLKRAPTFSRVSNLTRTHEPIDQRGTLRSASSAVYVKRKRRAEHYDVYGNVATLSNLPVVVEHVDTTDKSDDTCPRAPCDSQGRALGIRTDLLMERLLATLNAAHRLYKDCNFVGMLHFQFEARHIRGVPLVWGLTDRVMGRAPHDEFLTIEKEVTTAELDPDADDAFLASIVDDILLGWGCTAEDDTDVIVEDGEMEFYGRDACPGCKEQKSRNRLHCWKCRTGGLSGT